MDGVGKSDEGPPLLQIDPKCLQDALRTFFQPTKTDDPRLDFYTMYKREAIEYDTDYVKKHDGDLNTTLIFAGLFSAVSSAFVIDIHSNLQPDPNEQSAALLRAILLTLNQSAIPGETPTIPPVQEGPPSEIVTVTSLMYASLLVSMLAAFVAMLGKQWLNRYSLNLGASVIERCGDRQQKFDGLKKWPLHFIFECLPVMLQTALLLLACGLCKHIWSINATVARTLISLTGLGVMFYIGVVIAGTSSYACPFQTPVSILLRHLWKMARRGIVPSIVHSKRVLSQTHGTWKRRVRPLLRRQAPPTIPLENIQVQQSELESTADNPPQPEPLSTLDGVPQPESPGRIFGPEPWLKPKDLSITHRTNADDIRCVSWVIINIADPEALDAAIRLAGEIRWFDDGVDINPPYDLIVSTFEACFDSTRRLYPGSRDRAYYSSRAILWIHVLAACRSWELASTFPLSDVEFTTPAPDPDLEHLLLANHGLSSAYARIGQLLEFDQGYTHPHSQWASNLLLNYSWAYRTELASEHNDFIFYWVSRTHETKITVHLDTTLNRLLVWCALLGSPVEEEVLKVQNKSDRVEPILDRLSKAVLSALNGTHSHLKLIRDMLHDLVRLEIHPERLTEIAYEWCSLICENRESLEDWQSPSLDLVCLEIGFRHLDFRRHSIKATIAHTEHHRGLVDVVFKSQESEVIADLLRAWTAEGEHHKPAHALLGPCAGHLVGLHNLVPFSPRLRQLIIRSVELIGYKGFEGVEVERFVELLNDLCVTAEDVDDIIGWARLLLDTIQSPEGTQYLSHWYWEFLVEFAVLNSRWLKLDLAGGLKIMISLTEAEEWSKLECWMTIVWMLLPEGVDPGEQDLGHSMTLLFRQRPGAVQRLEQWMERWGQANFSCVPESFRQVCKQALEAGQWGVPPVLSTDKGTEGSAHVPPPVPSQPSRGNEFWELLSS